jgi:organic radical activating enzyme
MLKLARLNNKAEIFHTIQGEGKNIGKPSVFIRLSLCNLYCRWCDTDYTWNWEGTPFIHNNEQLPGYKKYDKDELIVMMEDEAIIDEVSSYNSNNLVITGGEPLVQQKDLRSLLGKLKDQNPQYHIEFETNGTLVPLPEIDAVANQYNVSVKLSNSGVDEDDRLNPYALSFFAQSPKSNFKFVIDTPKDLEEVKEIIEQYHIPGSSVYLMPQGISASALSEKQNWLVEVCKEHNYNYTDRLHIHIWGAKRGI